MKRIACFHLFNDYSGSPKVLKTILEGLLGKGFEIDIVTSRGGVLDELKEHDRLRLRQYDYRFARNGILRLMRYLRVQFVAFFMALGYMFKKDTVIYINTILPIGAAIGGRLAGKRVIYHYHENAKAKSTFYRILAKLMQFIASDIICVSEFQRKYIRRKRRVHVIPNALQKRFTDNIVPDTENAFRQKRVLMLGSLKGYKGTKEFIGLANRMKEYNFELIINDSEENIRSYIKRNSIDVPENITVHPRQNDVVEFYNRATVVLNLSNRKLAIETFGLTALEAMTAGLPVIVPTVGGIAEMVENGVNGYKIDVQELDAIEEKLKEILNNEDLFIYLANNAKECSKKYTAEKMTDSIEHLILDKY